jgi:hypothetical protein
MKNLLSIATLVLALLPTVGEAQTPIQATNTVGNSINNGAQISTNTYPILTVYYGLNPGDQEPFGYYMPTNQFLTGIGGPGATGTYSGLAEIAMFGFSIECIPYNPTLAATPPGYYPYTTETNGVAGFTVTIAEAKLTGPLVTIGTLVLPTSPHGGPYVNTATVTLPVSYVPTLGSNILVWVSAFNTTPTEFYQGCSVQAILH